MPVKKKKKSSQKAKSAPVQTFDAEDFDIHASEKSFRRKIMPREKNEPLVHVKEDIAYFSGHTPRDFPSKKKSVLITVLANVLLPGLGNTYAKLTAFSISILALSIFVMFITWSPAFPLVGLLNSVASTSPIIQESGGISLYVPANIVVDNQVTLVGPTFSILAVPLMLAWIHLMYLFLGRVGIKWRL